MIGSSRLALLVSLTSSLTGIIVPERYYIINSWLRSYTSSLEHRNSLQISRNLHSSRRRTSLMSVPFIPDLKCELCVLLKRMVHLSPSRKIDRRLCGFGFNNRFDQKSISNHELSVFVIAAFVFLEL